MEKIKKLLAEMGASQELVNTIVESLADFQKRVKTTAGSELKQRLVEARKLCIEEIEKEKQELARKVEIFLESKLASIERTAKKQTAIGEGKALKILRDAKALLEGITFEGGNPTEIQAMRDELQAFRLEKTQLTEQVQRAQQKATRANKVAMQLVERTRVLESKPTQQPVMTESKATAPVKKLEELRKAAGTQKTTRPVLKESVAKETTKAPTQAGNQDNDVATIASSMEEVRAF